MYMSFFRPLTLSLYPFFLQYSVPHRDLHSFPTRRSSDLRQHLLGSPPQQPFRKGVPVGDGVDRKSTRLNSSHQIISYAVFCLKKTLQRYSASVVPTQFCRCTSSFTCVSTWPYSALSADFT